MNANRGVKVFPGGLPVPSVPTNCVVRYTSKNGPLDCADIIARMISLSKRTFDIIKTGNLCPSKEAKFPSHGLILKQVMDGNVQAMQKSIFHWEGLYDAFLRLLQPGVQRLVETDMRAHLNPTRMKVIQQATEQLMKKVTNLCPRPGFGCVEVQNGLRCKQCGASTQLPLMKIYQCISCNYTYERDYTAGEFADPQYYDKM